MRIWGLETRIGAVDEQIQSLGNELSGNFEFKSISLKPMWRHISAMTGYTHDSFFEKGADQLKAPWPDTIINGHSNTAPLALLIKQRSEGKSFLVNLQDSGVTLSGADLTITAEHQNLKGSNIFATTGHLTLIKPEVLHKEPYAYTYNHLKAPLILVLGDEESQSFLLNEEELKDIAEDLNTFCKKLDGTLLISPHLDPEDKLKEIFENQSDVSYLFLDKETSLIGAMAWATLFICVGDGITTFSKACSTGKPVLHYKLDKSPSPVFLDFYQKLVSRKMISTIHDNLDDVSYTPLREAERVAAHITHLLQAKHKINVLL